MTYSAGIILYRYSKNYRIEFFVGHPGGPYNVKSGKWGFPKGKIEDGENIFEAAVREFEEETSISLPTYNLYDYINLGGIKQNKDKTVYAYGLEWDTFDVNKCKSNTCQVEYPFHSGIFIEVPEIDKFQWMNIDELNECGVKGQIPIFIELMKKLK